MKKLSPLLRVLEVHYMALRQFNMHIRSNLAVFKIIKFLLLVNILLKIVLLQRRLRKI
jgi:hypothetical protein